MAVLSVAMIGAGPLPMPVAAASAKPSEEKPRVAVMPLLVEGDVPSEVRADARDEIARTLRNKSYTLVKGRPPGSNCTDYECIRSVAKDADAQFVVLPALSTLDRDYGIAVRVYDFAGNEKVSEETTCEICSYEDAVAALVSSAEVIQEPLLGYVENPYGDRDEAEAEDVGPSSFSVVTEPPGAVVKLNGKRVGKTPLKVEVEPGLIDLEVSLRNHNDVVQTVRAPRGGTKTLRFELLENDEKQTRALRITGWTFSMLGVGLLGAGVPLLILEERPVKNDCSGPNVDFNGACRYRYDTLLPGALLTGFGIASLLTGIGTGMVAFSRRNKNKSKGTLDTMDEDTISVRPLIGPTSAGVRVRF